MLKWRKCNIRGPLGCAAGGFGGGGFVGMEGGEAAANYCEPNSCACVGECGADPFGSDVHGSRFHKTQELRAVPYRPGKGGTLVPE